MSYSSTGFSSCTTSTAVYSTSPVHTITIFSTTGKKDFVYEDDFVNAFTLEQLSNILTKTNDYSTEYAGSNKSGDEIYYDIDSATTFSHTLSASQNNTNEKTTVILVVNPLVKALYNPAYEHNIYVEEVPTTQQITLTTEYVDKNDILSAVAVVSDVDLKHAYLQSTYTVFSAVTVLNTTFKSGSNTVAQDSLFFNNFSADILFDENFIKRGSAYRIIGSYVNVKIRLNRIKYGLQRYWDTGNFVEIPFAFKKYQLTVPQTPDGEVQFFRNTSVQVFSFNISNIPLPTYPYNQLLYGRIYTFLQYKSTSFGYYEFASVYTIERNALDNVRVAPRVLAVNIDPADNTKLIITVNKGISGATYFVNSAGYSFIVTDKGSSFGSQAASVDGELFVDGDAMNITL